MFSYLQKSWNNLSKNISLIEKKKILLALHDFWKIVKDTIKDSKMSEAVINIHKKMMDHYEGQTKAKIDSCFELEEKDLLEELNL